MPSFIKCTNCLEPLDETDLVKDGPSAVEKPQRLVTTGFCPNCEASLTVVWRLEEIESHLPRFEGDEA